MSFLLDEDFVSFKEKIYSESGIHFSDINRPILESRIKERLKLKNIKTPREYFDLVSKDKNEMETLLDSVTTNLTKFFRNEPQFEALKNFVFPEIIERKKKKDDKKIKIWSAGCSTGEEPYTILMILLDLIPDYKSWKIQILASDISLKSLFVAKEGFYVKERVENIEKSYLERYFDPAVDGVKIKQFLKDLVRFDYHNLKFDNGERDIDVIFCRNVIIYFDRVAQIEVIKRFFVCLDGEGYLFIGHSESLFGMQTGFNFHKCGNSCLYRKV